MIALNNIGVTFNAGDVLETTALQNIKLTINAGEFITVIGSNGAGKSTLLNVLAGDITPSSGAVIIDNFDITRMPAHKRAAKIARVFQDPLAGTCAALTIEENMTLSLMRGRRRGLHIAVSDKRREHYRQRLSVLGLGLENRLKEYVGQLSGGQRQAVSLVMATLSGARILLLDEHTAALDPRMATFVLKLTMQLSQQYQLAALMVTHSIKSALSYGSRTLMLHQGSVILDISGQDRQAMTVSRLLRLFSDSSGQEADDDRLLLE